MKIPLSNNARASQVARKSRKVGVSKISNTTNPKLRKQAVKAVKQAQRIENANTRSANKATAAGIRKIRRAMNRGYNPTRHAINAATAVGTAMVATTPSAQQTTPIYIADGVLDDYPVAGENKDEEEI